MTARLPRVALLVLVVGLALHNLAMALLWQAGVRDTALDVVAAWKEALLLVALVAALAVAGSIPHLLWADRLALAYGVIVVVYWLVPQGWLDGEATARGELYALRHHLLPLGAYALGRLLQLDRVWWRRLLIAIVGVAAALAVWGLVDVYAVPLQWWRDSGVPAGSASSSASRTAASRGCPRTGSSTPTRRARSAGSSRRSSARSRAPTSCWSPSSSSPPRARGAGRSPSARLVFVGLLWTHTRAAFIALPVALLVLAALRRSWATVALAAGSVAASAALVAVFPSIGPETTYTATELACLRDNAAVEGEASDDPFSTEESSTASHLRSLRDGIETVARHPWGYGLGNAGSRRRAPGRSSRRGVDLHRARRRRGRARPRRVRRLARRARAGAPRTLAVALRVGRRGRDPRAADRRDRHPLARGRRLRPRGRGARAPPDGEPPERLL